ncbi:MAG TPA: phosphate transport regulator [Ottowia sp.]|uniref:phosphate transport regulator n=1 Tax=Ottowia sp. TaxID=1898956 RepID=UPI002C556223|nr:phosphate transport regulator [Ottowia sp.]HRQ02436.1 phosphate transport regulator [Ottowia sp.]
MEKSDAVASLGAEAPALSSLLRPAQVRAALKANDRLKLYLSVLQAASAHAHHPREAALDLSREIAAADISARAEADWLHDLPATAVREGADALRVPDLPRLGLRLHDDLGVMARPLIEGAGANAALAARVARWQGSLQALAGPVLTAAQIESLTHGQRERGDSLHITVMDLHKALNRLAAELSTDRIDGAHCWQLAEDGSDRPRVEAFMRGLNRTAPLKFDHPGLDTAATRDGGKLLIQNDIGTNDAHVLVIQVDTASAPRVITLTYSDLHRRRFAFFQRLLAEVGAHWGDAEQRTTQGLNQGDAYHVGTARFEAEDEAALARQLEGIGERIVFLIDWNRARKRLVHFVSRDGAVAVLEATARARAGHMAWLNAGAERLIWDAMAAQGASQFRLGDRLDEVLGEAEARDYLVDVMTSAARHPQASALLLDQAQAQLARRLRGRRGDDELLQEHAAYCHALAQGLRDALAHGMEHDAPAAERLAARAKAWERHADQLVVHARELADHQPQWRPLMLLMGRGDDVADALEEACFVLSVLAGHFEAAGNTTGWNPAVRQVMNELADAVLNAVQDHVKALAVARTLGEASQGEDQAEYLSSAWRVQQAERLCDELLRRARRELAHQAREQGDAVALTLGNELAAAIEDASDALLALGWGLRERTMQRMGVAST